MGKLGRSGLTDIYFSSWHHISEASFHIADSQQHHSCFMKLGELSGEVPIQHIKGFTFTILTLCVTHNVCDTGVFKLLLLLLMWILNLRSQQCQMLKSTRRPPCSGITSGSTQCSRTPTTLHASSSSEQWPTVWAFNVKYAYWKWGKSSVDRIDRIHNELLDSQGGVRHQWTLNCFVI